MYMRDGPINQEHCIETETHEDQRNYFITTISQKQHSLILMLSIKTYAEQNTHVDSDHH